MAAPKGNKFWMARYNTGRKPKTESPAKLWEACVKYFEFVEENPMMDLQVGFFQGEGFDHPVPKMRAPTMQGLWIFLGISKTTWHNWKDRKGFLDVITRVEGILYDWKFRGAAAGMLNPVIIARDLGLKDKTELSGEDGALPFAVVRMVHEKS